MQQQTICNICETENTDIKIKEYFFPCEDRYFYCQYCEQAVEKALQLAEKIQRNVYISNYRDFVPTRLRRTARGTIVPSENTIVVYDMESYRETEKGLDGVHLWFYIYGIPYVDEKGIVRLRQLEVTES